MTNESVLNFFSNPSEDMDNVLVIGGHMNASNDQSMKIISATTTFNFTGAGGRSFVVHGALGNITRISAVLTGTPSTAGTVIGFKINTVDISGGDINIGGSDAVGTVYSMSPTGDNSIVKTDAIEMVIAGGGYANGEISITFECELV